MTSDGCTGFWFLELFFKIHDCCVVHDGGGSDGTLLDCIQANIPHNAAAYFIAGLCISIMMLFRPIYHLVRKIFRF